jgi:hypothetical protein
MDTIYRPTPCVVSPYPLGTTFRPGEELPVRARDDLDPFAPPLEYADGRISWSGHPTREARDAALSAAIRAAIREAREAEEEAAQRRAENLRRRQALVAERVGRCLDHEVMTEGRDYSYMGSVAVEPYTQENQAAHGNICRVQTCRCGAERLILINGRHTETSPWRAPDLKEE